MLSEVPDGWIKCSLGEVLSLEYGKSLPEKARIAGQYPVYGSAGRVGTHNEYLVKSQSIVVGRKGTVGAIYKTSQPFFPIDTTYYVVVKNETNWDWLTALLESLQLAKLNEATGVPGLNRERAYATEVCIPPLNEQQRIAEILSSVDASIQATQAVIDQAERVKRGLMEELLTGGLGSAAIERGEVPEGWSELSFGELTSIVGGTTPKKNVEEYWDSEDILWATPTDITSLPEGSHFLHDTATKASISAAERGGLKLLPADTVLMTSRATIGYVAIAKSEMSTNQGFANFLPSDKFIPLFLLYLLHSKRDQFINSAGGSTFKEISKGTLKSLTTLLPPLNEQKRIADILASVDDFIAKHRSTIEQQNRIKQGLMDDLLTGKVRTL